MQPSMVLHELAHAYHHQFLGYDYKPIKEAYTQAVNSGIYESVKHANGKMRRATTFLRKGLPPGLAGRAAQPGPK